jgi:hypothetical protein
LSGTPALVSDVHEFDFDLPPRGYVQVPTMESDLWANAIVEKLEEGAKDFELATITAQILEAKLGSIDIERLFNKILMNDKG